jgi:hypothetical protein
VREEQQVEQARQIEVGEVRAHGLTSRSYATRENGATSPSMLTTRRRPYKLRLTWLLDEVFVRGRSSPYHGALEIHSYCEAFVGSLAHLERVIDCVRSQPD